MAGTDVVSQDFLKEYIQYSRHLVAPVITEAAVETLVQVFFYPLTPLLVRVVTDSLWVLVV